jgi:hypothetical protein
MGIAMPRGTDRPVVPSSFAQPVPHTSIYSDSFADLPDCPSDRFSNEHGQQPLRIEILDAKRQIHRAFARPAAGRWDRREMRVRRSEVDFRRRRPAERLMRAEARVVDEAQLDLLHQI